MPINPNIAMSGQPVQVADPMAMYAQMSQIKSAQNQNALAQYQLGAAQRTEKSQNVLADAYAQATDPVTGAIDYNKLTGLVAAGGGGAQLPGIQKSRMEQESANTKLLSDKLALLPNAYKMADTPEAYLALHRKVHADPVLGPWLNSVGATPEKGLATLQNAVETGKFDDLRMKSMQSVSQLLEGMKPMTVAASSSVYNPQTGAFTQAPAAPEKPAAPTSMVAEYNFAKTLDGGGFKGSFQDFVTARAAAGRAPVQPQPAQPPVAVVDPVTGKPVYVSREQAISGKMAPAAAQESLPPKEIQKREAALPQATTAVTGFEKKSDSFIKDLTELRNHPGLASITGIAAGRLPGITAEGRAAQALYDKVVAKGGFQALQDLRDASKTGGALGNVSNQEGKQLTASFSAIDRRQDAADVKAALDQAIGDVQGARARMREAYDMTYSYKADGAPTPRSPGAAPAAPNIDALLNKYK